MKLIFKTWCPELGPLTKIRDTKAAKLIIMLLNTQLSLDAFCFNYSLFWCFNTSKPPQSRSTLSILLTVCMLSLQSTCQILNRFVYSDVHYSKNKCFQLCFRLQFKASHRFLMTPAPCNFFSVAVSDYRVGVELQSRHHLFQLSFCICSLFKMSPAAVWLSGR